MRRTRVRGALMPLAVATAGVLASAQSPVKPCDTSPTPAWCNAVVGDRAEGWLAQPRSEVMARNGIVTTSQPLAAQAGLEILKRGGNAIDAAVATAAVLTVTEPMNVGPGGDMFAVIYVAKERNLYAINASGKAPTGATLELLNGLGYHRDPANWAPAGLPARSMAHLNVMGLILSSAALAGNVDTLLRNLTRRLSSFPIATLMTDLAADINQVQPPAPGGAAVTAQELGGMSMFQLVEFLNTRGLLRFQRAPEEVARARLAAERATSPGTPTP